MENENRIRPLKSIKTNEEYESYQNCLARYLSEYKLYQENEEGFVKLMAERASKCPEGTPEKAAFEGRLALIRENKYIPALERNITAYMLAIKESEAKNKNKSLVDVIKGILTKDDETMEYLKERFMKSRAESSGLALTEPINLSLQDPYDAVMQVFRENEYINIETPERALIPVEEKTNEVFSKVREMLNECLKENGVNVDSTAKENVSNEERKVQQHVNINKSKEIHKSDKNNESKDERDEI